MRMLSKFHLCGNLRSDLGSYFLSGQKNEIPYLMRINIIYVRLQF